MNPASLLFEGIRGWLIIFIFPCLGARCCVERRDKGLVDSIYFSMFGGTMLRGKLQAHSLSLVLRVRFFSRPSGCTVAFFCNDGLDLQGNKLM